MDTDKELIATNTQTEPANLPNRGDEVDIKQKLSWKVNWVPEKQTFWILNQNDHVVADRLHQPVGLGLTLFTKKEI